MNAELCSAFANVAVLETRPEPCTEQERKAYAQELAEAKAELNRLAREQGLM